MTISSSTVYIVNVILILLGCPMIDICYISDEVHVQIDSIQDGSANVTLTNTDGSSFVSTSEALKSENGDSSSIHSTHAATPGSVSQSKASSTQSSLEVFRSENRDGTSVHSTPAATPSSTPQSKVSSIQSSPSRPVDQLCLRFPIRDCPRGETAGLLAFEVNQQEFYIQLIEDTELLEQVVQKVQLESTTNDQIANPVLAQACLARFSEDGAWYRATIAEFTAGQIQVLFVDFGNRCTIDPADVLVISEDLSKIHPLAIRCALQAENPSRNLTEWATGENSF